MHMMIPCTPTPGARTHAEIEAQREKRELLTRMHENEAARDRTPQRAEQPTLCDWDPDNDYEDED